MVYFIQNLWVIFLFASILVHFIVSLVISVSYHWGYLSTLTDIGTFDQAVWSTLNGEFFLNTNLFNQAINYFGIHFRPILFIFLPLYKISPNIEWMIFTQSIALSLTALPIFLLARHVGKSDFESFCFSVAFLVNPFIVNLSSWVFRPESIAVPFIALGLLAIEKINFRMLFFSCLIILACKEHFGFLVIGFGFLWGLKNGMCKETIFLLLLGTIYSIVVLNFVMPAFSPIGKHVMIGNNLGQLSRYSWLGNSFVDIFQNILLHPFKIIETVLVDFGGIEYLGLLLVFVFAFPLLAIEYLLPGIGDLAVNLLSANPMPRSLFAYHSVSLVPVIIVAAIYGSHRLAKLQKKFSSKELAGLVLLASLIGGYCLAPLPLLGARNLWKPRQFINQPDLMVPIIRSTIGQNASVSAQANIGAHFSQRMRIYRFPNKIGNVDAIILRLESPTQNINNIPENLLTSRKHLIGTLDAHLQMDRIEYISSIKELLTGTDYGILLWQDPWLVFKQGSKNEDFRYQEQVERKLETLCEKWQVVNSQSLNRL